MAHKSSQRYSAPAELRISSAALQRRWPLLSDKLRLLLGIAQRDLQILPEASTEVITAGFVGRACEVVERDRGHPAPVAPLLQLRRKDLMAWLGYHEMWESKLSNMFAFHHVSLTVHLGYLGDPIKPQIFRSEWPGFRAWTPGNVGFQSPGAGHPHWQFDAMKTFRDAEVSLARLRDEPVLTEFNPAVMSRNVITDVQDTVLERIHFASGAPWWLLPREGTYAVHMNAPSDADSLLRWTVGCVAYIRDELQRC